MNFGALDIFVFVAYIVLIITVAMFVSRKKKGEEQTTRDYFLAGNTLPWWAIGTSLIAANISAEQLIGMTGDGFTVGLAVASYELMAAATLLVVAKYFLPIFLEKKIYSMPQFLDIRYDGRVRTVMAVLWLFLYVFVNLTSIMYLGAVCIKAVFGIPLVTAIVCIAAFSAIYTILGGLKAIAYTDFIQVGFLIVGGLITSYLALEKFSGGLGVVDGLQLLVQAVPEKFDLIFTPDQPYYSYLPGIFLIIGPMWIMNLNYWGCNQYITQRALAAKSLDEAQKGLVFAGFLKLLMPLIVVLPGIIAFALNAPIEKQDETYPWLLNTFLFEGIKGISFAALVAAIVGALSSKTNSIATIFTMDIYKNIFGKTKSETHLVNVGRVSMVISLVIGVLVAPQIENFGGGFAFIQVFSGFFSPGIFAIFVYGLFWKRATANAAFWVAVLTLPISLIFFYVPALNAIPFILRMGWVFAILSVIMIAISLAKKQDSDEKAIIYAPHLFKTGNIFNVGAVIIILLLVVIYYTFW